MSVVKPSTPRHRQRTRSSELLQALESRLLLSGVTAVSPLASYLPNESTISSPKFSNLWYLNNTGQTITNASQGPATGTPGASIHAADAWDLTTGKQSVVVAVFDTGTDITHPDLVDNLWKNPGEIPGDGIDNDNNGKIDDVYGWNFVNGNNNVSDSVGHGTTVAGVIAAQGNNGKGISGVAWDVSILTIKVGTASGVSDQALIDGINYVIALKNKGVNIVAINASYISTAGPSFSAFSAISSAGNAGILYVAAAGNSSFNLDIIPSGFLPSNMMFVAATDSQDKLASFSNYGSSSVALGAPGVDITTTFPGGLYITASGTSYAAPMVAGIAALLKSAVPNATMSQIKNAILTSGDADPYLVGKTITGKRANAYNALQSLLGSQPVTGHLDVLTTTQAAGWAFDANLGRAAVNVQLVVDGVTYPVTPANITRTDLQSTLGSADHGFSIALPTLAPGIHTIKILAVDAPGSSTVLLGQGNVTVNTLPAGSLDIANPTRFAGWAVDLDSKSTSIQVRVDVDGSPALTTLASINRADLAAQLGSANHGYDIDLSTLNLPVGTHTIAIYALDTLTGATLLGSRSLYINNLPTGSLDVASPTLIAGWAFDPNSKPTALRIRIDVDNLAPIFVMADQHRADIDSFTGGAHAFNYALPQLTAGNHTVKVWAVDADDQALGLLKSATITIANPAGNVLPTGSLDILNTSTAMGWVNDANAGASISARIDIDGVAGTPFLANASRPDLAGWLGSSTLGFNFTMPSLSAGVHRVDLYAIDSTSGTAVLVGSKLLGNAASTGAVEVASSTQLTGWAFSPLLGSAAASVRLDIDGTPGALTAASLTRSDLTSSLGSPDHGFSISLPTISAGQHRIILSVQNPYTLEITTLYDAILTFS